LIVGEPSKPKENAKHAEERRGDGATPGRGEILFIVAVSPRRSFAFSLLITEDHSSISLW
jgi:hypothetical protein